MNIGLNSLQNVIPKNDETIVAIATPSGRGGVGIVRVSGPLALLIAAQLSQRKSEHILPRKAIFSDFYFQSHVLDQGLLLYFPKPASFTGEDVVEFQVHGSPIVLDQIVRASVALGARLARPGEFSERAFLNGKMDLTQAEAIADLIHASSEQAARSALRSMEGVFSKQIAGILEQLIDIRMWIESSMDFADEDIDFLQQGQLQAKIVTLTQVLEKILHVASEAVLWTEGVTLVLAGFPNVGKSSLLNALVEKDAAIVTDIPGTTRDVIREVFQWHGILVQILDTAGLRHTEDLVEQEGVRRTRQALMRADLVCWVMDARESVAEALRAVQQVEGVQSHVPRLIVRNKVDLVKEIPALCWDEQTHIPIVSLSAQSGDGLALLGEAFQKILNISQQEPDFSARTRHVEALKRVTAHVRTCAMELHLSPPRLECAAEELRMAQQQLSEITGEFRSDDLLGRIFSTFCIGK